MSVYRRVRLSKGLNINGVEVPEGAEYEAFVFGYSVYIALPETATTWYLSACDVEVIEKPGVVEQTTSGAASLIGLLGDKPSKIEITF
jgi:hypothetical protein